MAAVGIPCQLMYIKDKAKFLQVNYSELNHLILKICQYQKLSPLESEEVREEFFYRYLNNIGKFDPSRGDLKGYLIMMLNHVCQGRYAEAQKDAKIFVQDDLADTEALDAGVDVELDMNSFDWALRKEKFINARLKEQILQTFRMKRQEFRDTEIAKTLKVSGVWVGHLVQQYQNYYNKSSISKEV